jgi:hypothetical protein
MLNQLIGIIGALLVLSAYLGLQRGWLRAEDRRYDILNFLGAGMLAYVAILDRQWGFILLEGVWALAALPGVLRPRPAGVT